MIKVYGTPLCPDCEEAEEYLKAHGVVYEYVNITETTANLKAFLKIRDAQNEVFKETKEVGGIGIPCFVLDNGAVQLEFED